MKIYPKIDEILNGINRLKQYVEKYKGIEIQLLSYEDTKQITYNTIKDACKGYFKKELREMTDYECIMLAGIPNAPSVYAPTKNPDLTRKRARHVIRKMVENEYITQEEADKILKDEEGG